SSSDWLTNLFLYTFIFGLIFTVASLLLSGVHIGGFGHSHTGSIGHGHIHIGGHSIHFGGHAGGAGHTGHVGGAGHTGQAGHVGGASHGSVHSAATHDSIGHKADLHVGGHHSSDPDGGLDTLGIFNMPTIMAFITWFGGAGYIFSRALPVGDFV